MEKDNNVEERSFQILIASKNVHKIRELRSMLQRFSQFDILSLHDFPKYVPPEETGSTFKENATIKATHAAKELGVWAIADDSGLVVPSLNGKPGVFSARFAGPNASDMDNRKKLLSMMQNLNENDRDAYFECSIALASPNGELHKIVTANCEGSLLAAERGGGGFGYDPLFIKHEYSKTFAELEESIKNQISHRRKALDKILVTLESLSC